MSRLLRLWLAATLALLPIAALAQQVGPNQASFVMGNATGGNQGYGTINATGLFINGVAVGGGGGCTTNCTFGGTTATTNLTVSSTLNGWGPGFGLVPQGTSLVFGGTVNAAGDVLTLNDGCASHAKIVVVTVSSGVITSTGYNIVNQGSCATAPTATVGVLSSTGSDTSATFSTAWAPSATGAGAGVNLIIGTLTNNNGNTFLTAFQSAIYAGTESVWVGYGSGGHVGTGSFDVAVGHNAIGVGGTGCPVIYVNSTTAVGTDALRNTCGNSEISAFGASALKAYNQTGTVGNRFGRGITSIGSSSMLNWNGAVTDPFVSALGDFACQGAVGSAFTLGTCIGARTGAVLTTASNFLIIAGGANVGNATYASGAGVILVGSGQATVDTPLAATSHYINFENIWTVTGTDTPATSAGTIAGSLNVIGTLSQNGTPVSTGGYAGVYGVSASSSQTAANQGTGYVVGDALTLTDGCGTSGILTVRSVSGGLVTGYIVANPGSCTSPPNSPVATTGGTGTGATFNLTYAPLAAGILTPNGAGALENFWTGNNGPAAGYTGQNSVFVGPEIAKTLTGASNFDTGFGFQACGGISGASLTMTNVSCFGDGAGKALQGTSLVTNIDVFGSGSLSSQAQAIRSIAGFGASTFLNLNTSVGAANLAAFGTAACEGVSAATFSSGVCLGTQTGLVLSSATNFLIMGPLVGKTTFASGHDVLLAGTSAACDTPATNTTNYIALCAGSTPTFSVTGAGTPSTAQTTVTGTLFATPATTDSGTTLLSTSTLTVPATYSVALFDPTANAIAASIRACNSGTIWDQEFDDATGQAATHNITLTPSAGTINGSATALIGSAFGSLHIHSNGAICVII